MMIASPLILFHSTDLLKINELGKNKDKKQYFNIFVYQIFILYSKRFRSFTDFNETPFKIKDKVL